MKRGGAKKSRKDKKSSAEVEVVMDEEIWKEIPKELLEVVIAKLPIHSLIRFRLVCQKWNSLIKSPRLQQLSASFAQPLLFSVPFVGNVVAEIGALYDPSNKKWGHTKSIPPSCHWNLYNAASSGGLVCHYDIIYSRFRVGNCLTQTWKELPWSCWTEPSFGARDIIVGMVTDSHPSAGYKIVWVNGCGDYRVYDSIKETITAGRIPAHIKLLPMGLGQRTVSIDAVVYFLARKPDGIISYDVASGAWEQLLIPDPPFSSGSLAECGGRILLAGEIKNVNSNSFSVCVWELEREMLCWKEVDRMPSFGGTESIRPGYTVFHCLGNMRVLFMSLFTNSKTLILTYDVVSRKWSEVPRFTIPGRDPSILNGVGFFPSLSASP